MIDYSPCKINLGLEVTSKRPDGYHNIESVMYPVPLFDIIEVYKNSNDDFEYSTSGIIVDCEIKQNILYKLWQSIHNQYGIGGITLHLHKQIPTGAGLGGGSANAATLMKMLNKLYSLNLSQVEMEQEVSKLGSDCAFFIESKPAFVFNTGTDMLPSDLSLKDFYIQLVKPNCSISTAKAYQQMRVEAANFDLRQINTISKRDWKVLLRNRFEEYAFGQYPELFDICNQMYNEGAFYAAMSGSGSCMFALYKNEPIKASNYSDYFYWQSKLL